MSYQSLLKAFGLVFFSFLLFVNRSLATHIRAGEIIAVRTSSSSLTYRFTIIAYTDTDSEVPFGGGELYFGHGEKVLLSEVAESSTSNLIEGGVMYNAYVVIHVFPAIGSYIVQYTELNRNAGVQNMSNSVDTPFYIETKIVIDPVVGLNDTPIFLVPPIDHGAVGGVFLHNPGAFDKDGDSLSYHITTPQQFFQRNVNNYLSPADPEFYDDYLHGNENQDGIPVYEIDPINGTLKWDAPGTPGEYNIAFVVKEWRSFEGTWLFIGSVTRDMQIIIEDSDNNKPEIILPPDLCVLADSPVAITEVIVATDPDGDEIEMEAFGGPFEQITNKATISPSSGAQPTPASIEFSWQPTCAMVRRRPYEVVIKAKDKPTIGGPQLANFKTWKITVVAPAPTGLVVTSDPQRTLKLDWDAYECGAASKMQIWRRVDKYAFDAEDCEIGLPAYTGYQMVDIVDIALNTYTDLNGGEGLAPGALYCYRIVAVFTEPAGGESYASAEVCQDIGIVSPVMLNVDVRKTDTKAGEIYIRWQEPTELDELNFPRTDFSYDIVRFDGSEGGGNPVSIGIGLTRSLSADTTLEITDTGLNTELNSYHYRVYLYGRNLSNDPNKVSLIDSSALASTVWLDNTSSSTSIDLLWDANVPWSILVQDSDYKHDVFRRLNPFDDTDQGTLIGTVDAGAIGTVYKDVVDDDNPLSPNEHYEYRVLTRGRYGNDGVVAPLDNYSQWILAKLDDGMGPDCPPVLSYDEKFDCQKFLSTKECSFSEFFRELTWEYDYVNCDKDVYEFHIYFSEDGTEEGFGKEPLAKVKGTSFKHEPLNSFMGAYKIQAVDEAGNVGEMSEPLVADNCPNYKLPNAFSPNGDNVNDTFTPMTDKINGVDVPEFDLSNCPRFVERVEMKVFDRTGGILYDFDSSRPKQEGEKINNININWNGKTNNGRQLPAGVYFYGIDVTFVVLDSEEQVKSYKGWIQILK